MQLISARCLVAAALLAIATGPAHSAGRGWLGVTTQATDEDLRRGLDLKTDGLLVNQVSAGSPAEKAGVKKGDVIMSFNNRPVTDPDGLRDLVRDTKPGTGVPLDLWRSGAKRTLRVTVAELPAALEDDELEALEPPDPPLAPRAPGDHRHRRVIINGIEIPDDEIDEKLKDLKVELHGLEGLGRTWSWSGGQPRGRLGVRVERMNGELAQALGAVGDTGALVVEVLPDTPAKKAGLKAGDIIVRVANDAVKTPGDLTEALAEREGKVSLTLLRKGRRQTLDVELASRASVRGNNWIEIPEPGRPPRGYRWRTGTGSGSDAEIRRELEDLKRELKALREQIRGGQ